MPSPESAAIRKTMVMDSVPAGVSMGEERRQWEAHASTMQLAEGMVVREEAFAGVACSWVEGASSHHQKVILYVHGGGLIAGSPRTHSEFASRLSRCLSRRVLLVDYRLAPEHPFPAALEDVTTVYLRLIEGLAPDDVTFGAESTGAALALSALLKLKGKGARLPSAAFFISGHFDMTLAGESMLSRREFDPFTSREALERAVVCYTGGADPAHPLISPLFANLEGLPPMLLQVGQDEILLSDSLRVADEVRRRAGRAELRIWAGMWHNWPMYPGLPEGDAALAELAEFLAHLS